MAAGTSYSGPPPPGAYAPPPLPPTTAYGTSVPPGPMPPGYGAPPASASAPSMPGFGQALQEHSDQDRTSAELLVQVKDKILDKKQSEKEDILCSVWREII